MSEREVWKPGDPKYDDLARTMRTAELQRRTQREKILLNHAALSDEPLSDYDKKVHEEAMESVREQVLRHEKETTPGYFRRLWNALKGR